MRFRARKLSYFIRAASRRLGDETGFNIPSPLPVGPDCQLIGARRCTLNGRAAAFALYEMSGQPASLVVVERDAAGLTQMESIGQGEGSQWVDRCEGDTVVIRPRGEMVYAAVAKLYNKYHDRGFTILAVNAWNEDAKMLKQFAKTNELRYPVLLRGATRRRIGVSRFCR